MQITCYEERLTLNDWSNLTSLDLFDSFMATYYFLVSLPSGLNIPNYKNNLLLVDKIAKEFRTSDLCITCYILQNVMCILCSVCSNYNSRAVLSIRVLCSTVLRLWCLSESYSRHRFVPEFYCTYACQCRSCDPPKTRAEALTEYIEKIVNMVQLLALFYVIKIFIYIK